MLCGLWREGFGREAVLGLRRAPASEGSWIPVFDDLIEMRVAGVHLRLRDGLDHLPGSCPAAYARFPQRHAFKRLTDLFNK